ncbi:alpha/beta hydrolase [Celerinatantimonas yamalensis]|uniref:Alpha/beta hydrolase n=1 Tax=Celerinatantimonas yamalensis TaxID=559956 RepID=A0ABW9G2T7_9GAMM
MSSNSSSQGRKSLLSHPVTPHDLTVITTLRGMVSAHKGKMQGTVAREPFNAISERVSPPNGVEFCPDSVGGIPGTWCLPARAREGEVFIHLHGGWFNWGTSQSFRNLVGQMAVRSGVNAFIPDYRLAPEHPFPSAVDDIQACYQALVQKGLKVAVTGDSAGGNLALVLAAVAVSSGYELPVGVAVLSPVTDLALTGPSFETKAEAEPYFTRAQVEGLVGAYLGTADPRNWLASPLYGDLQGLPPVQIHVGEDEILLDDSRRYFERAIKAGNDVTLDIWEGMPHGFANTIGQTAAAELALNAIGEFLSEQFQSHRGDKV